MNADDSLTICPGCGLRLPRKGGDPPDQYNASPECLQAYSDLLCYTVAKQDPAFIHQHAVDAYAAQHAGGTARNITVAFGLIGLYLALEKGYTGKQVQRAHLQIAKVRKDWPRLEIPSNPASLNVMDVLQAPDGEGKDAMIRRWMAAVWESWGDRQQLVRENAAAILERSPKKSR
jgi:hypothetical protein